ncbi:FmdB family transcriptional regulator [Spirochaetia bacterium]|nr:FmdB family transcriptional regulator [Spirochaetia bacterium]
MPTYEYECKKCNLRFEVFQSMSDKLVDKCPECGHEVRRLINGGAGVIYKGAGFYSTEKASAAADTGCAKCPHAESSGGACPSAKAAG